MFGFFFIFFTKNIYKELQFCNNVGNMSKFDEMEAKINKKLDTANAMAELNNSQKEENIEDLIAKYDNETKNTSSEIDDELSELKSKLGLDK